MMALRFRLFLFSILIALSALAQQEYTLHFVRDNIQRQHTNPAFRSEHTFTFALPSLAYNFGNNAFSYNDVIKNRSNSDSTYMDVNGVISQMGAENILQIHTHIDVVGLYYNYEDWYFSFFMSEKVSARLKYSKDMVDLMWNGNAKFIGQTIEIGPDLDVSYYKELSFGAGRRFDKWDVGAKVKFLAGIANVTTVQSDFQLRTGSEYYETTLSTDYEIKTSGVENAWSQLLRPPRRLSNPGMSMDFGGVYRMDDKWTFTASLIDVGFISWRNGVKSYRSKGSFTFRGLDLSEFIDDDELDFESYTDSIKELYFEETPGGSYTSWLAPQTYMSAFYDLNDKTYFGGMLHMQYFKGVQYGLSLYAGHDLMKYVKLGVSYSIKNRRFDNVGFNLNVGPKGFRLFIAGDNLVNVLNMRTGRNVTWRYGVNINIGPPRKDKKSKKKIEEDE